MALVVLLATVLRFLLVRANKSSRVARTVLQADDADKPLVGNSNVAMGDFEYML
jgi:hypothetical protein